MAFLFSGYTSGILGCVKHSHTHYEIVVMHSGECVTTVDGKRFSLTRHSVLLLPPHTAHESVATQPYGDYYLQTQTFPFPLTDTLLFEDYSADLRQLAALLHQVRLRNDAHDTLLLQHLLNALFASLNARTQEHFSFAFSARLKSALEKNLSNATFSIPQFITENGYSVDHARRCFKQDLSLTPQAYLTRLRLEYAATLLRQPSLSIAEVALQCGYPDPYYFSRVFRQYFGTAPSRRRA